MTRERASQHHRLAALTRALRGIFVLALSIAQLCGCVRALTDKPPGILPTGRSEDNAVKADEHEAPTPLSLEDVEQHLTTKATRVDLTTKLPTTQVVDGWYRDLSSDDAWRAAPGEFRWRHDALAGLIRSSADHQAALAVATKSKDKFVRAAANIGLARSSKTKGVKPLVAIAGDASLPLSTRRAAIETLAALPIAETESALRTMLERYGPTERGLYQEPLLFAEALVGLARHVAVDQDPVFITALTAEDAEVQLAALSLFSGVSTSDLPLEVVELAKHPQPKLRRAALAALVACEHVDALPQLMSATQDADVQVRIAAIELLGRVREPQAVILLSSLASSDQERHREAAFAALVQQQEWTIVERAAQDTSYRVRAAVATALAKYPHRDRAALAQTLVKDGSAMVQARMCQSLAEWPQELAAPLLFTGLASTSVVTRQAALAALRDLQVDVGNYNPQALPPERHAKLVALREAWQKLHPMVAGSDSSNATNDRLRTEEVLQLLKQYQAPGDRTQQWMARKQLERKGAEVITILDRLAADGKAAIDDSTYQELLASISSSFADIEQLRSTDLSERRTAARRLASQAKQHPLPQLALVRMAHLAASETDSLVWQDLLRAAAESKAVAHELALAALAHREADVRRQACDYLARHGDARQASHLLRLINDRDPLVVHSAVSALGRCGPSDERDALHALLAAKDLPLQVAAAKTLAQWHDPRGEAALERLALAGAPATRRLAIAALAQVSDPASVNVLLQLLDEEPSIQLAALNALDKIAGEEDAATKPAGSIQDRVRAWREKQ